MPYRHAHWWVLALFPLIVVAFWPNYLGQFSAAPFALHAHGITAGAWLLLLAAQSASIHARRPAWHRAAGLATFIVLPLFAAAGPLALQGMAILWVTNADPFHAAYGARLVVADMVAGPAVVALVVYAFINRRRVRAHAAAMLGTALLVLPPILGRLLPAIPGFPQQNGFAWSFQLAQAITLAIAAWLAMRDEQGRPAFLFVAAATLAQMAGFAATAGLATWERFVVALTRLPTAPMSLAAGLAAAALLWWAWRAVPPRGAATASARPAAA